MHLNSRTEWINNQRSQAGAGPTRISQRSCNSIADETMGGPATASVSVRIASCSSSNKDIRLILYPLDSDQD